MTTNADALLEDPLGWEEDEDYTLRQALGLRPVALLATSSAPHPDRRPCPPWCWKHSRPDYEHEVDRRKPFTAMHSHDVIDMPLSCYYGQDDNIPVGAEGEKKPVVLPATLAVRMTQEGAGTPYVELTRHAYGNDKNPLKAYNERVLLLNMNDVRDLRAILEYLLNVVDQDPAEVAMTR